MSGIEIILLVIFAIVSAPVASLFILVTFMLVRGTWDGLISAIRGGNGVYDENGL